VSIRPSTVLRVMLRGALGLLFILPLLLLISTLFSDLSPVPCYLDNLTKPNVAGRASKRVLETSPGILDFRALSNEYDSICITEVYGPRELYLPGGLSRSGLVGQRYCGGWESDSILFALIKTRNSEQSYVLMYKRFTGIPSGPPLTTGSTCAPTKAAIARCIDRGASGIRCSFNP
jgi:hypothetical protein